MYTQYITQYLYYITLVYYISIYITQCSTQYITDSSCYMYVCMCIYIYIHTHICCFLVAKSCLTLCNPIDCGPSGLPILGIAQHGYSSGLPFPSPGDLPDPGIELHLQFIICISFLSKVGKKTNTSTFEIDSLLLLNPGWWAGVFHHYFLC